nr:MFS transporter [Pseudofrankia sp. DC12]
MLGVVGLHPERALGLNSVMMSTGFTSGAVLGGVLTDLMSWRWAFLVNVPIAPAAAVAVAPFVLTDTSPRDRTRLDLPGAALVASGLLALVYGATRLGEQGVRDRWAIGSLVAAALLVAWPGPLSGLGRRRPASPRRRAGRAMAGAVRKDRC